ncbi:unnamed protein product [Hymenolepis diminuta]|uniref:Uncharacterized protein n=1 Tax=Hymenolepis diminuta TaxID=6216 RepID=A0A564Z6Z3_HYMDI|nr:unnamed protein product [Hymenolepis diminuta]
MPIWKLQPARLVHPKSGIAAAPIADHQIIHCGELTKSGNDMFNFNVVFFVGVHENEIFSMVVEENCDSDDIPLRLAHADHEISIIRQYFQDIGCQIYDIQTSLGESIDSSVSNCVRDYVQRPPGLKILEQEPEQSDKTKLKRKPISKTSVTKRNAVTLFHVPDVYKTSKGSSPNLMFITNEALSSDELLKMAGGKSHFDDLKRAKSVPEKKATSRHSERSEGKKTPLLPQSNHYLLGSLPNPQRKEIGFFHEISTCALKMVQMKLTEEQTKLGLSVDESGNPIIQAESPKKSKEFTRSQPSKMVKATRKRAGTSNISTIDVKSLEEIEMERKIKLKLLKDEAERVAFRLQLIRKVGVKMLTEFDKNVADFQDEVTKWIEKEHNDLKELIHRFEKYVLATIENGGYLKYQILVADDQTFANQENGNIFELRRLPTINPFEKPPEEHYLELDLIKSLSKLKNQVNRFADPFLSLFENAAFERTRNIKLNDLIIFIANFISKSPIEGLVRSMHVLQPSTCELLDERDYQELIDVFNFSGDIMNSVNDFAVSKEVTEEVLIQLQTNRVSGCVGIINAQLNEIFTKYVAKEVSIQQLLCDSQFHSLCERLISNFHIPRSK